MRPIGPSFGKTRWPARPVLAQGGIPTRGNYRQWLLDSFTANKPYDVMVAELIDPTMPGHQAAENQDLFGTKYQVEFVRNEDHTVTLQTAAAVGQVFLSTAMKCASCHDHFENAAVDAGAVPGLCRPVRPARSGTDSLRRALAASSSPARFPFDLPAPPVEIPSQLDERLHAGGAVDRRSGQRAVRQDRSSIGSGSAIWARASSSRSTIIGRSAGASHPELLTWLARDFVAHGCDLKHTIRLILTSRTYQLPYEPKFADRFDAADPAAPRYFRSPALRRLTAEQVIDSLRMATTGQLQPGERAYLDARITALAAALGSPPRATKSARPAIRRRGGRAGARIAQRSRDSGD